VEPKGCLKGSSCRSVHPSQIPSLPSSEVDQLVDRVRQFMRDSDRKKKLLEEIPKQLSRGR
jgi:hypothetical protein